MQIRLYISQNIFNEYTIQLSVEHTHYLFHVMRCQIGDYINIFNQDDGEWSCKIHSLNKKVCILFIEKQLRTSIKLPNKLILCYTPTKRVCNNFITQKATELGVDIIQPIITCHSVIKNVNQDKMAKVAIESAEQCDRLSIPKIYPVKNIIDLIVELNENVNDEHVNDVVSHTTKILFGITQNDLHRCSKILDINLELQLKSLPLQSLQSLQSSQLSQLSQSSQSLRQSLPLQQKLITKNDNNINNRSVCNIYVFIGPEGGFTKHEIENLSSLLSFKFDTTIHPIQLGLLTLRADTAIIALLTFCNIVYGDWLVTY